MAQTKMQLSVEDEHTVFTALVDGRAAKRTALPWSWETVCRRFVRHEIPTEAEVEYAINFIEDELMKSPELRNLDGLDLVSDDPVLRAVLHAERDGSRTWSRDDIEGLFTRYARISMGRSPVYDDLVVDAREYLALLVVREILHHLDYASITV